MGGQSVVYFMGVAGPGVTASMSPDTLFDLSLRSDFVGCAQRQACHLNKLAAAKGD